VGRQVLEGHHRLGRVRPKLVRGMIEESAAKYAKEKNITPRDCSKES
jgi:hypothetical protein